MQKRLVGSPIGVAPLTILLYPDAQHREDPLYVEDADAVYARALRAGATVKAPLEDVFWADCLPHSLEMI